MAGHRRRPDLLAASTVRLSNVSYRYGRVEALRQVSLTVPVGVTVLLGPNGAGKSTLLELLATLRRPTSGAMLLNGSDVDQSGDWSLRRSIGYLPQRYSLMANRTALQNVAVASWVHGLPAGDCVAAASEGLARVGMDDLAGTRVGSLSGGQRQRVAIACALAHDPAIVILDEPTVGLDPAQRRNLSTLISTLGEELAVVVSTHLVEDVSRFANRVVVLNSGTVVFDDHLAVLEALASGSGTQAERIDAAYEHLLESAV